VSKGFDNEYGCEITWTVYNVEDLTVYDQKKLYHKMMEMKSFDHPNVIKYLHVNLNERLGEIIVITELANSFKHYIKKMDKPKLKVVTNWCHKILDGLEYLFSKNIFAVNLCPESIYANEQCDIKVGDISVVSKFKETFKSVKKKTNTSRCELPPELLLSDLSTVYYNFGKIVLYMIFHNPTSYKNALKIMKSSNSEILYENIADEGLRDFLKKILVSNNYK